MRKLNGWVFLVALCATSFASAGSPVDSPWAGKEYPQRLLWGDTHVHSSYSLDANLFGLVGFSPRDAYRFARGETLTLGNGLQARINRPLDFLVVADHAEYLGVMPLVREGAPSLMTSAVAQRWRRMLHGEGDPTAAMVEIGESYERGEALVELPEDLDSPWKAIGRIADEENRPGVFTAFIGFEWSAMPGGDNLHRVVMFRDGGDKTSQVEAFSAFDSSDPRKLWRYLEDYEAKTGGQALAIPHNSNLSGGRMFAATDLDGDLITADYARQRIRWEPVIEVTQIKGDSEAHPSLSPEDEFADYGTWDEFNIDMSRPQEPWMQRHQYARPALQLGLEIEQRTGVNPYRFGMIGSTDSHTGMATAEDNNFWGKQPRDMPSPLRASLPWGMPAAGMSNAAQLASGYAAVWATDNSREAIFDAFMRREVYATTGPRMAVRFFGGWDFSRDDIDTPDAALTGYKRGVPMGTLLPASDGDAPRFMVWALKDPDGANLDRVQVVKGWIDASGQPRERIHNVAWSGDRQVDAEGRLPPVGDTVDRQHARYRNTIGAPELKAVWTDPDFDPAQRAFYYVRVLEIPTPRWPLYDQVRMGAKIPEGTVLVHQERAYTSPIWYEPGGD